MTNGPKSKNAMWGGRFAGGPDEVMERLNASVAFDRRLADEDIRGSRAHAAMLARQGIISQQDAAAIDQGLLAILDEIQAGEFRWDPALEDVHLNIEARLKDKIGEPAGRLHTARSRNDQVATDLRLWTRDAIDRTCEGVRAVIAALLEKAETHADTVMPGFTHLQTAQPVTFGHHCLAYVEMLARDHGRLMDARARLNECPLGAAALAGTGFPIDRGTTAEALGFDRPMANSLDAVSARDFALEALGALGVLAMHLSRSADEFVLWSTPQFGFVEMSDRFSTGSSIMPQKRNPDAAELIRGKVGRIVGAHQSLLMTMKGLPLAYSKDMQEDKEPVFDAFDQMDLILPAMAGMVESMTVKSDAMRRAAGAGHSTATDLADWLVREQGVAFRDAHHMVGAAVAEAEKRGCDLAELPLAAMQDIDARIDAGAFEILSVGASVASRTSYGGTSPKRVREQISAWRARLEDA